MKNVKHLFVALLIVLAAGLSVYFLKPTNSMILISALVIIGFLVFNLLVRKSLAFKNYFTSPYNPFTTKLQSEQVFDIPKDLMFEKIKEVINDSEFTLINADEKNYDIIASTSTSLVSWGENLYINFDSRGKETLVKFCSVTLFQVYSWGKNEKNWNDLLHEIESSLTI